MSTVSMVRPTTSALLAVQVTGGRSPTAYQKVVLRRHSVQSKADLESAPRDRCACLNVESG
jgi:hypothetical protein